MLQENLKKMTQHPSPLTEGMDVVIISTTHPELQSFWSKRFAKTAPFILKPTAKLFTILEDWPGGAGNGLGSLYAFEKGCEAAHQAFHLDLKKSLKEGASIAIYHTAGKGQRTCPLSLSECHNKSALKMPAMVDASLPSTYLTLLEAVIKQTALYAPSRKGRLSVFWGDQLFIPSTSVSASPKAHVDILTRFLPFPNLDLWEQEGWSQYGLCLYTPLQKPFLLEKMSAERLQALVKEGKIDPAHGMGLSLGCFSLSNACTLALLELFQQELQKKTEKRDSDPHFWMPLTLDQATYINLMEEKGMFRSEAEAIYTTMQRFLERFCKEFPSLPFFSPVDIGKEAYWWDYGTVKNYYCNLLKMTNSSAEAEAMRAFFRAPPLTSSGSVLIDCQVDSGKMDHSVLVGVKAKRVDLQQSVCVQVEASEFQAEGALAYHVVEETAPLHLKKGEVRADLWAPHAASSLAFYTTLERDGKTDWNLSLPKNKCSYAEALLE